MTKEKIEPKKVTKATRAGKFGREITCPTCEASFIVYHFSWSASWCKMCKALHKKTEWIDAGKIKMDGF